MHNTYKSTELSLCACRPRWEGQGRWGGGEVGGWGKEIVKNNLCDNTLPLV